MSTNTAPSPLLNRNQAAEFLGIGLRSLDELTANGSLKCIRIGRSVRVRPAALNEFVEANETRVAPKRRRAARGKTSTASPQ